MYNGATKVPHAETSFLNEKHWSQVDVDQWVSEWFEFEKGLPKILSLVNLETETAQDIYERYRQFSATDDEETQKALEKALPDNQDYSRWMFKVNDRKVFIQFSVDSETALELAGYGDDEREASEKWQTVSEMCEVVKINDDSNNTVFEQVGRSIWELWNKPNLRKGMGWIYQQDVFKEEEMRDLAESPAVLMKIDLRQSGKQFTNTYRFFFLLELDSIFPDRHFLLAKHLTNITQKNSKPLKELIKKVKEGMAQEEAEKELDEILAVLPKDEEETHEVVIKGRKILIDGEPIIEFDPAVDMDSPEVVKTQARLIQGKVKMWIHLPSESLMVSDEKGNKKIATVSGGELLSEYFEKRGIAVFEF